MDPFGGTSEAGQYSAPATHVARVDGHLVEQLDDRINPSVSGAARVSSLIRAAAAAGQGGLS